jgi:hypothetical protein
MKRWILYVVMLLLVLGVLSVYLRSQEAVPLHLDVMWKRNTKPSATSAAKEPQVPEERLAFRNQHHLRALTELENGTHTRDAARGVYGYSTCDAQTLHAAPTTSPFLEVHKHLDGIVYYVGYASEDDIERYVTRQKNFRIVASLERRGKASLLFEIPVAFVSKCTVRSGDAGTVFDLFVTAIPELQSFLSVSDLYALVETQLSSR